MELLFDIGFKHIKERLTTKEENLKNPQRNFYITILIMSRKTLKTYRKFKDKSFYVICYRKLCITVAG